MSRTQYGVWRYAFVPQRKFERAIAANVRSLAELMAALVSAPAEPQLQLISLEDERVPREAFKTLLPVYSLKAAAGYFGSGEEVEPEGWVEADFFGRLDNEMFVARVAGRSMEPVMHDGDFVVFRANPKGSREGKIVLAQYRGPADPDTGGAYSVKRYTSEKTTTEAGGWRHKRIVLAPVNRAYKPILIGEEDAHHVRIVAEFMGVLRSSH